jgi:hypothetical protein
MATLSGGLSVYREAWSGVSGNQSIGLTFGPSGGGGSYYGGSAAQQSFPTSAYGETIPVVYGKARLPGAYIWAPDVIVKVTTRGAILQTTTVTVNLSARIRFGRPLVADSRWRVRRLWADGTLLLDKSTGYRRGGLNFREYDGYSSQGRDPTMTGEEGTNNVSAHRGYLDIVITNYNLGTAGEPPPAFEAEWVQEPDTSVDTDSTTGFFSNTVGTYAAVDWDNNRWYGIAAGYLRCFEIGTNQEVSAIPYSGLIEGIEEISLRYIPEMHLIVGVDYEVGPGGGAYPFVMNPETGEILAHGEAMGLAGEFTSTLCAIAFGANSGVLITSTYVNDKVATYRFTQNSIERVTRSGNGWDSRVAVVRCMVVGDIRASDADVYILGSLKVFKTTITSSGLMTSITELYADADSLVYGVYHDDGLIVWNDNAEVMRINASTGAVEWTTTVPYQITDDTPLRPVAPPEMLRLDGDFLYQETTQYNFTDLDTGETESISKSSETVSRFVYDGLGKLAIHTNKSGEIAQIRYFDAVGDGSVWELEDFLTALMVAGGFEESEITCENIDDDILGAVIDITGGVRDIARQVCDPYSIAMFERAGQIVFKRALTDGSFALDVTIGTADVLDRGGQAITATKLNPQERAAKYGLNHRDPDEVYQAKPQWGEIPSLPLPVAVTDIGIKADIPIIIEADTAKILATKRIWRDAVQVHEFSMSLKAEHLKIEPETVSQFTYASRVVTGRVLENTIHPNFTNSIVVTEFLTSASVTISGATGRPVEPEAVGVGLSRYVHLDIPLLAAPHDLSGSGLLQYHALVSSGQLFWPGATLFRKDSGTYIPQTSQVEDGLRGIALDLLPDVDIPYATEFDRTLTVAFPGTVDLPASLTYEEMLSGTENYFAIGAPGRWEIVQVQTITNNGDGTATFETFRRCLDQSEEYTGDHAIGDEVVYLSGDNIQRLEYPIADLGDAFDFKAVGIGSSVSGTVTVYNRTVTGEAEKIPKPGNLKAEIDGSDIDLSWTRRTRIGSFWHDDGSDEYTAPLGETLEQYIVRIKDGPGGTVLRTFTVDDATTKTYLDADITTDFGSMPAELTYDIRQVSGTGVVCPTREATITL